MRYNSGLVKPTGATWQLGTPKLLRDIRKRNSQNLEEERHAFIEREILPPYQVDFQHNSLESTGTL